jgi:RNA polymerase I-specific transcription initiation factor RRN6
VPDPFILKVPKAGNIFPGDLSSNHAKFVFRQIHHTPAHAKMYHNPDLTLIKLFWADQSLSIHESLFKGPENHRYSSQENAPLDGVNALQAKPHLPPMKESTTDERGFADEEFVVEDWDETAVSRLTLRQRVPDVSATESFYDRKEDLQWTLDWTNVYARAVENFTVLTTPLDPEETQLTLNHIIEVLSKDLSGSSDHYHASKTM